MNDAVAVTARASEPDRYLAALLAPTAARPALEALAAFAAELARVGLVVIRDPTMGEIRLQWWRDVLALPSAAQRTGNPVADALLVAVAQHALPKEPLLEMIDARALDLRADAFSNDEELHQYLAKTEGALFALAGTILGLAPGPALESVSAASGQAYGLARHLFRLPQAVSRGRVPLPLRRLEDAGLTSQDLRSGKNGCRLGALLAPLRREARARLGTARRQVAELPRQVRLAFLPLVMVESYLRALEPLGAETLRRHPRVWPVTRMVRIAVAHWLGGP